jgi:DNA (cytosine-5)-methyltransferase 1
VAGNRKGADDSRELSGEVLRIAEELGYPTLYLENVPGIRKFWYYNVRPRLQSMGYRVEEVLVTAAETGAPHKRQRLFILAHHGYSELSGWLQDAEGSIREPRSQLTSQGSSLGNSHTGLDHDEREALRTGRDSIDTASLKVGDSDNSGSLTPGCGTHRDRQEENQARHGQPFAEPARPSLNMADTAEQGLQGIRTEGSVNVNPGRNTLPLYPPGPDDTRGWESVHSEVPSLIPTFCRVAYGPTPWLDQRLRAIGNGVVPASAARAWQILSRRFLDE